MYFILTLYEDIYIVARKKLIKLFYFSCCMFFLPFSSVFILCIIFILQSFFFSVWLFAKIQAEKEFLCRWNRIGTQIYWRRRKRKKFQATNNELHCAKNSFLLNKISEKINFFFLFHCRREETNQQRSWVYSVSLYNELKKDTQSNRAREKSAINIKIIIKKRANDSWFFYDFFNDFLHFYELNFSAKNIFIHIHLSTVCMQKRRSFCILRK